MTDLRAIASALFRGDTKAVLTSMTSSPVVQDQRLGMLDGRSEVERWVADSAAWLVGLKAEPTEVALIRNERRSVLELSLAIHVDGEVVDLPYVLVADRGEGGITELRTYHSTWPYTGDHVFRAPPLAGRPQEAAPAIFQWYIERISVADIDAVLARFTEDGYLREPSGDRWKHQGAEERAGFYGHLVHAPRARFELMTSTVEGPLMAIEYAFAYGDRDLVGGICIMEVAGDRIVAVRIADDVSP